MWWCKPKFFSLWEKKGPAPKAWEDGGTPCNLHQSTLTFPLLRSGPLPLPKERRLAFAGVTVVLISLTLSSCGFQPMYGDHSAAAAANYSNVEIENIPNRDGQYLRNQLIDRMYLDGRPSDAAFTLRVAPIKTLTTNIGIERNATATRAMAEVDTTIQLIDNATNKVLLQRDLRATGGYNLLDNQFATIVSRQSVDEHMLEELADDIVTELGLYFHRAGNTPGQMPVSIAKPTRSPSAPIATPAVPGSETHPIRSDVVPVTP